MSIRINNNAMEIADGTTLRDIADSRKLPAQGVAMAVNNEMVPREKWAEHVVHDGDDIVILKAFCGG